MRVLVTGASGFVGSSVLRRLLAEGGHEVAAFLRASSRPWRISDLLRRVTRIDGDLNDLDEALPAILAFRPDVLIHLAWEGVGPGSRNNPGQVRNVPATVALVRLAHEVGAGALVGLGSQAEYGMTKGPVGEEAPTRPTTHYGIAKLAAGLFADRLCHDLGMRFAWLRLFSVYGPGDDPAWMIPTLIQTLLRGDRPALTAGTQRWDYLYVEDAARAIVRVAVEPGASGVFNLGSGQSRTIRSVAEQVRDVIDPRLPIGFGAVPYSPHQVMHLEAENTRLRASTGWAPEIDLDDGLRRTIAWYREQVSRPPPGRSRRP